MDTMKTATVQTMELPPCSSRTNNQHLFSSWKGYDANTGRIRKTWTAWVCVYCGATRKRGRK